MPLHDSPMTPLEVCTYTCNPTASKQFSTVYVDISGVISVLWSPCNLPLNSLKCTDFGKSPCYKAVHNLVYKYSYVHLTIHASFAVYTEILLNSSYYSIHFIEICINDLSLDKDDALG